MGAVKAESQLWRVFGLCLVPSPVMQVKSAQCLNSEKLNMGATKVSEPSYFLLGSEVGWALTFPHPPPMCDRI